jgi:hypothetical protein
MAHLLLLARYFPKLLIVTKSPIDQGLRVYLKEKFLKDETKCDKSEQLLSQAQQMSQGLERKIGKKRPFITKLKQLEMSI